MDLVRIAARVAAPKLTPKAVKALQDFLQKKAEGEGRFFVDSVYEVLEKAGVSPGPDFDVSVLWQHVPEGLQVEQHQSDEFYVTKPGKDKDLELPSLEEVVGAIQKAIGGGKWEYDYYGEHADPDVTLEIRVLPQRTYSNWTSDHVEATLTYHQHDEHGDDLGSRGVGRAALTGKDPESIQKAAEELLKQMSHYLTL